MSLGRFASFLLNLLLGPWLTQNIGKSHRSLQNKSKSTSFKLVQELEIDIKSSFLSHSIKPSMSVRFDPKTKPSQSQPSSPNHSSRGFPSNLSSPRRIASPRHNQNGFDSDMESQPLLNSGQRGGGVRPIVIIAAILVLGAVVGAGGWMLSRGQGGARWPGGPH